MRMKSFYVIINPHANFGKGKDDWQKIQNYLDEHKIDYRSQETAIIGDAKKLTINFINHLKYSELKNKVIIAVGGMSTLNEVLTGIKKADRGDIPLGFIPIGRHRQFADDIGIAQDPLLALQQILNATDPVDYSIVQYHETNHEQTGYFLSNYEIGTGANIAYIEKRKSQSWLNRHWRWIFKLINICKAYYNSTDPFNVTLRINERYKFYKKVMLVNLRNHAHEVDFENDRPSLNLVVINKVSIFSFLILALVAKWGNILKLPFVNEWKTTQLHITINSLEHTQIDNHEIGGKYNDLYLKLVKYPFWINIDSVPLEKRRQDEKNKK